MVQLVEKSDQYPSVCRVRARFPKVCKCSLMQIALVRGLCCEMEFGVNP